MDNTDSENRNVKATNSETERDPDRWIEAMLEGSYDHAEYAIQEAVQAIIETVEETGKLADIIAVLKLPPPGGHPG